jgi:hypothetical protein
MRRVLMGDDEGGTGARTRNVGSSGPGGFGFCDTTAVAAKSAARNTMTRASAGCAPVGAKSSSPSSEEQLHPCAPPRAIARRRVPAAASIAPAAVSSNSVARPWRAVPHALRKPLPYDHRGGAGRAARQSGRALPYRRGRRGTRAREGRGHREQRPLLLRYERARHLWQAPPQHGNAPAKAASACRQLTSQRARRGPPGASGTPSSA